MTDHYAVLGVPRNATIDDIRRAYRNRMRKAHPDSRGGTGSSTSSTTAEVTRIAEAWNVLSSPARRAAYDLQLATGSAAGVGAVATGNAARAATSATPPGYDPNLDRVYPPARFPWRFVLTIIGIGAAILIVLHIMGDPMPERGIDGLISAGSCVDFDQLGAAFEVPCSGPHQAVVRELVPFDSPCDSDTTQARDRQGMGTVCIEP
ncbi:MAG: J domain-containing protein [Actinobacteria bacterium]|nr:J domain-containing protein [Actinomycetota bacterium]